MSLGTKLVQAVQKEAAMQRPLPMRVVAHDDTSAGRVTASVDLADNDRFSHMTNEVTVSVTRAKGQGQSPQATAQRLAERATYLTERLQFVESGESAAILRSSPQTMREPRSEYFEAQVKADAVTLKRYQPHAEKPGREAVPFCVTDDVLGRLTDDAAATLLPTRK